MAFAEQREAFGSRIAHLARGVNGLVEVQSGRCVVAPLGSVPDELAHQDGCFGLDAVKLPSDPGAHDVSGEETHLPEALAGVGEERRRRDMYVLLIEVLYLVAQVGGGHEISAAGVRERVVHPLRGFGQVASGQQVIELVERDLEYAGEPRTYPGLGFGLTAFPARHRGAVNTQPLRQLFLAETGRFAPGREAAALGWHYAISDLRRLLAPIGVRADHRRACGIFAAVLRNFCSVNHRREPIVF